MLVVAEFALSLVLLVAAALLLRSFWDLANARLGFDPQNVLAVRTRMPYPNDPKIDRYRTAATEEPFLREWLRISRTLPGVEQSALGDTASIPLDETQRDLKLIAEGQLFLRFEGRDAESDRPTSVERSSVTPEYFHLLRLSLLRGRLFDERDTSSAPQVAVVNQAFARKFWPNQDPLRKRFKATGEGSPWITVVGLIADARTESLAVPSFPKIYLDLYQTGGKRLAIFLRGRLDACTISADVQRQVLSLDSTLPVFGAQTLNEAVSASLSERRFLMEMVGLFALTALLLAAIGIYGVISYMVSERTHEIGIRRALGATRANILGEVLRQGLRLAIAGAAVGIGGALIVAHLMAGLLYGVAPTDPLTFTAVAAMLILVALLASCVPAWRATKVDPMIALREA
jgi:putative ABC transport system permease protein